MIKNKRLQERLEKIHKRHDELPPHLKVLDNIKHYYRFTIFPIVTNNWLMRRIKYWLKG